MNSRIRARRIALATITTVPLLTAAALVPLRLQPETKVWVEGGSTVRDWSCKATQVSGAVRGEGSLAITDLQQTVRGAEITIPVKALECGNGTMNEHLRKALRTSESPTIRFQLSGHRISTTSAAEGVAKLNGRLEIAGQEKPVVVDATVRSEGPSAVRVTGGKEILMSEFGVKPPTLMMGTLKVKDRVVIKFDVLLKS